MFIELTTHHCPAVTKESDKIFINVEKIAIMQGYKDTAGENRTLIILETNQRIVVEEPLFDVLYSIDPREYSHYGKEL